MKLNKSKWRKIKFGDAVFEDKKTVDARSCGLDRYIAGEHMSSSDLHLRNWGIIGEDYLGPAFHRKFEKGDILYGSRRTYLKKVAIARFDGITSNTTFVLKENTDIVVPGFIPFLMLSDKFTEHSVKHSKGSVNPYINFKDLANYEFLLPPIEEQKKIADLLWAEDNCSETLNTLKQKIREVLWSFVNESVRKINSFETLENLGHLFKGKGIAKSDVRNSGLPSIRYGELYTTHHIIYEDSKSFIDETYKQNTVKLQMGDVLFAGSGETIEDIGKAIAIATNGELYAGSDIVIFRPKNLTNPYFWGFMMNSQFMRSKISRLGKGAQVVHIYSSDLAKLLVPNIDLQTQNMLGAKFQNMNNKIKDIENEIMLLRKIKVQITNSIFSA